MMNPDCASNLGIVLTLDSEFKTNMNGRENRQPGCIRLWTCGVIVDF